MRKTTESLKQRYQSSDKVSSNRYKRQNQSPLRMSPTAQLPPDSTLTNKFNSYNNTSHLRNRSPPKFTNPS